MYQFLMNGTLLPVAPEKLTTTINNANKTQTLIDGQEVNFLKPAALTDIGFEIILPAVEYPFATYADGFKKPKYFLQLFEKLKTDRKPFTFAVARTMPNGKRILFDTSMQVSLESYEIVESVDDGFDVRVSIELKKFVPFGTKLVKIKKDSSGKNTAETASKKRDTGKNSTQDIKHKVVRGDCLWNLAKRYYGKGSLYMKIFNANRDKIKNPDLIIDGWIITIPDVPVKTGAQTTTSSIKTGVTKA